MYLHDIGRVIEHNTQIKSVPTFLSYLIIFIFIINIFY
jgi:HD superfamily phosphodiesterase